MADATPASTSSKTALRTALWLAAFVVLAFTLRTAFNMGGGFDEDSGRYLFTGNDPYYDWRSIEHTLATGENLDYDNAINYPEGRPNPNPPLYDWTVLPLAAAFQNVDGVTDPTGLALNIMVAFWAALTVIPVYMIGRDLFGRKAGLWAALFMAISAPHIQRTVWGYPRHESILLFALVLGLAFMVRALKGIDGRDFVGSWRNGPAIKKGLRDAVRANRQPLVYAALAGLAITACANTWKGYPYVLAIMAVGLGFQLLVGHLRNRDSTAVFLVYILATAIAVFLPWVMVYQHFPGFLYSTVNPSLYVLYGMLAAGLILVPTRDLPSILVFPALLLSVVLGLLLLLVAFPAIGHTIFSGLGYFNQSKLYGTIAEAQRPRLGEVAANFGFFSFLIAFWGFGRAVKGAYKGDAPSMLVAAWAAVALFMTFAASRFLMNAAPVMSILTGYALMRILSKIGGADVRKRFRAAHGTRMMTRTLRSLSWKSVTGVVLVALFLVLPNAWTGVDASMSTDFEVENGFLKAPSATHVNRFGAFGIDFELKSNGWLPSMAYLASQDTGQPIEQKPGFVAWWDYGHWAVGIGDHPTVADPFQSHYELAGRFLASDTEEEAMAWLAIHLIRGNHASNGGQLSPELESYLETAAPNFTQVPINGPYDPQYEAFNATVHGDAVYEVYDRVCDLTNKCVGYMGVDSRMYPYDDPNTQGIDRQSIFYAPVFLANKNPDDYMKVQFRSAATVLTMQRYAVDAQGNSYELPKPTYVDPSGQTWVDYQGSAFPVGRTPLQGFPASTGIPLYTGEAMQVTPKFHNTLYARAFGGLTNQVPAGEGLRHWRVVQETLVDSASPTVKLRDVAVLEYFRGVNVRGSLMDDAGQPLVGYTVAFQDGSGAVHGGTPTDPDGTFTALAPFAQNDDLSLVVRTADGTNVHTESRPELQFTREQARGGARVEGLNVTVARGSLLGHVFVDEDGDGVFGANDTALGGAQVQVGGMTTSSDGATGTYGFSGIQAGTYTVSATLDGYRPATQSVTVRSGEGATVDLAMEVLPINVHVTVEDSTGTPLEDMPVHAQGPSNDNGFTNVTGVAALSLTPGTYQLSVDTNVTKEGQVVRYQGRMQLVVPLGSQDLFFTLRVE